MDAVPRVVTVAVRMKTEVLRDHWNCHLLRTARFRLSEFPSKKGGECKSFQDLAVFVFGRRRPAATTAWSEAC